MDSVHSLAQLPPVFSPCVLALTYGHSIGYVSLYLMKKEKCEEKTHSFESITYQIKKLSYLQDLAPLRVAVHVLTGMKHAQCHTVQQDHQHGRSLEPRGGQRLRNTTENRRQQLACQWHEPGGYSNNKHLLLQLFSSDLITPFKCINPSDGATHVCLRYHFTIKKMSARGKGSHRGVWELARPTCGKGHLSLTVLFTKDLIARRVGKRSAC